jgi:hypothetical protein
VAEGWSDNWALGNTVKMETAGALDQLQNGVSRILLWLRTGDIGCCLQA